MNPVASARQLNPTDPGSLDDLGVIAGHEADRSSRDAPLELMVAELQHRIRNLLTVVQCLATSNKANTANDFLLAVTTRVAALSDASRLIEDAQDHRVSLTSLLERALRPHPLVPNHPVFLAAPDTIPPPHCALSLH